MSTAGHVTSSFPSLLPSLPFLYFPSFRLAAFYFSSASAPLSLADGRHESFPSIFAAKILLSPRIALSYNAKFHLRRRQIRILLKCKRQCTRDNRRRHGRSRSLPGIRFFLPQLLIACRADFGFTIQHAVGPLLYPS